MHVFVHVTDQKVDLIHLGYKLSLAKKKNCTTNFIKMDNLKAPKHFTDGFKLCKTSLGDK